MTLKELTSMKLHEIVRITEFIDCIRVDGGWIYMTTKTSTFVPESKKDETVLLG